MDDKIRNLERRVLQGDLQAAQELISEKIRRGFGSDSGHEGQITEDSYHKKMYALRLLKFLGLNIKTKALKKWPEPGYFSGSEVMECLTRAACEAASDLISYPNSELRVNVRQTFKKLEKGEDIEHFVHVKFGYGPSPGYPAMASAAAHTELQEAWYLYFTWLTTYLVDPTDQRLISGFSRALFNAWLSIAYHFDQELYIETPPLNWHDDNGDWTRTGIRTKTTRFLKKKVLPAVLLKVALL